jgi:hypothetical protein
MTSNCPFAGSAIYTGLNSREANAWCVGEKWLDISDSMIMALSSSLNCFCSTRKTPLPVWEYRETSDRSFNLPFPRYL